ncbi:MAG TPA: dTDP-4-dehydrorhamnose reductase [Propionicimonas sp.]|jgi:dTDP-4-dehydrorhamnose reductase
MRWLVVGSKGMLGTDLVDLLTTRGHEVTGVDRGEIDITVPDGLDDLVTAADVLVNCAAWTAVDAAETEEPAAFAVNATGAGLLAAAAARAGTRMVQISTDYVFDGVATTPYAEGAATLPRSAYGRTKLAGEWAVRALARDFLVVRTAWLYGAHGGCFPKTIARVAAERGALDVVDDQVGQPTWTVDLADLVARLVEGDAPSGVYHGTSSGRVSWFGFAQATVAAAGMDPAIVRPTTSTGYARPAPRPAFSVLGHDALDAIGVAPIGDWSERWSVAAAGVLAAT